MKLAMLGLMPKAAASAAKPAPRPVAPRRPVAPLANAADYRLFHAWRA